MNHYRVYKLRGPRGPIVNGKDVIAPDDAEAIREAQADGDCPICEVWTGSRKVGLID